MGKPDFVFPKQKIALFVDGCFWHGCPQHGTMPSQAKNNRPFWEKKLAGNVERDAHITRQLRKMGWKVIRVWEHELKVPARVGARVQKALDHEVSQRSTKGKGSGR
jgi:DNA mismatch endonuclease, patch repair protein